MQPLLYSPASPDADDIVGAYAFSATLAIQDITGDAHSGLTASHMLKRLEGSAESEALLFALTSVQTPRPLGARGYPELRVENLADIDAWVFVSLPLLEDTRIIEAAVTLDAAIAPLPGEPVPRDPWTAALSLIDALSHSHHRPTRHIWDTHAPDSDSPAAEFLAAAGYTPAYREEQATFPVAVPVQKPAPVPVSVQAQVPADADPDGSETVDLPVDAIDVVFNNDISSADLDLFRELLTAASRGYPRGELALDTVEWTEQRLRDAQARLLDRGGSQFTAIAYVEDAAGSHRQAVGLAEAVHYDVDDASLIELGLVYVLPEYRSAGVGSALAQSALSAAKSRWREVETGYSSHPSKSDAVAAMCARHGAEAISATTAWQKP